MHVGLCYLWLANSTVKRTYLHFMKRLYYRDETFSGSAAEVIAALKLKIKDQEKVLKKDKSKCLICMVSQCRTLPRYNVKREFSSWWIVMLWILHSDIPGTYILSTCT